MPDSSARTVLARLAHEHPGVPFIALGQTVFWDEPMKAALLLISKELGIPVRWIAGVHDTDYFAKLPGRAPSDKRFVAVPHNDTSTRSLWSAAGEVSALFGSETVITHHHFARYGVSLEKASHGAPPGWLDAITEAWGWRGLVHTTPDHLVFADVCIEHGAKAVRDVLQWAFEHSLNHLAPEHRPIAQSHCIEPMMRAFDTFGHEGYLDCLSRLYRWMWPHIVRLLTCETLDFDVTCSMDLFAFTPDQARKPRFTPLAWFLDPATRTYAEAAYNQAVDESEIYTLERFGEGALPFDLVIRGRGRGTLHVNGRQIRVDCTPELECEADTPVTSPVQLAQALSRCIDAPHALVGKAVMLVSMLCHEFLPVMNEEGSAYVSRTHLMHEAMRDFGFTVNTAPILRIVYPTWDALAGTSVVFHLPNHLAAAFGRREITGDAFAAEWRAACDQERDLLDQVAAWSSTREALDALKTQGSRWAELHDEYHQLHARLDALRRRGAEIGAQMKALYEQADDLRAREQQLERAKGSHWREILQPLRHAESPDPVALQSAEAERQAFDAQLATLRQQLAHVRDQAARLKPLRLDAERGQENKAIRERMTDIEAEVERHRALLVRQAITTIEGLRHTGHRPTAWWFPLVDPTGQWFRNVVDTAQFYTQEM